MKVIIATVGIIFILAGCVFWAGGESVLHQIHGVLVSVAGILFCLVAK